MQVDPRWYESFFGDAWLRMSAEREERAVEEVDGLLELIGLEPGARILDCPCGTGRHSAELARRGFRVTGVDLNEAPLAAARERGADVELVRGDMRALPVEGPFDAVLNLWTSFGYFADAEDDARTVAEFGRVLAPGGTVVFDAINPVMLAANLRPRWWGELEDGTLVLDEIELDPVTGRSNVTHTIVRPDGARDRLAHSARLYSAPELAAFCRGAGLEPEAVYGGLDGEPFSGSSRRVVLVARKPA